MSSHASDLLKSRAGVDRVYLSTYRADPRTPDVDESLTPVMLLHGITSAKETWKDVIQEIADATGRMVYSFDARNHGDSGWSDIQSYEVMADDLSVLIERLDIAKVILIGHSMGAKTALLFSLRKPNVVEKLVIEDFSPKRVPPSTYEQAYLYIELLKEALKALPLGVQDLSEAKNFVANYLLEQTPQYQRSDRHGRYDQSLWPLERTSEGGFRWKLNLATLQNVIRDNLKMKSEMEGLYEGPVLFLYGTRSPFNVMKDKDFILNLFPNATFQAIEGAAHQVHLEYRDEFLKAVIPFLQ